MMRKINEMMFLWINATNDSPKILIQIAIYIAKYLIMIIIIFIILLFLKFIKTKNKILFIQNFFFLYVIVF